MARLRGRRQGGRPPVAKYIPLHYRAYEALSRPDALPGFLEVVHRLFEDGVFVGHDESIRVGILRSLCCFSFSHEHAHWELLKKRGRLPGFYSSSQHYMLGRWISLRSLVSCSALSAANNDPIQ